MTDKKLSREEAQALYDDMQRAMQARMLSRNKGVVDSGTDKASERNAAQSATKSASQATGRASYSKSAATNSQVGAQESKAVNRAARSLSARAPRRMAGAGLNGQGMALIIIAFLGCAKITLSAIEASGVGRIEQASASVSRLPSGPQWTKEQAKILTALDARRVELEERGQRLDKREGEFGAKEREVAVRLTALKELSEKLKNEREKGDKQRNTQLDQLANVYGSMNPPEAAHLLEQLDIQVALSLVERMPEKRMAQILSLMNAQRALELTNLLTHRER